VSVGKPEPSAALPFPCPPHPFRRFLRLRVPPPLHPSRNNPQRIAAASSTAFDCRVGTAHHPPPPKKRRDKIETYPLTAFMRGGPQLRLRLPPPGSTTQRRPSATGMPRPIEASAAAHTGTSHEGNVRLRKPLWLRGAGWVDEPPPPLGLRMRSWKSAPASAVTEK